MNAFHFHTILNVVNFISLVFSFSYLFLLRFLKNNLLKIDFSYEQQSLAVNDIFPPLPKPMMPESSVLIKIKMHDKIEDDDSCFTDDDDDLQFGEIEY